MDSPRCSSRIRRSSSTTISCDSNRSSSGARRRVETSGSRATSSFEETQMAGLQKRKGQVGVREAVELEGAPATRGRRSGSGETARRGASAATCEVCGNEYDKTFEVRVDGSKHTFDSFECAIQA